MCMLLTNISCYQDPVFHDAGNMECPLQHSARKKENGDTAAVGLSRRQGEWATTLKQSTKKIKLFGGVDGQLHAHGV